MVFQVSYRGYGRGYGRSVSGGMGLGPNLSPYCRWSPGTPSRQWAACGYPSPIAFQPAPIPAQYLGLPQAYPYPWQAAVGEGTRPQLAMPWAQPLYPQPQSDYGYGPNAIMGTGYGQGMGMRYRWGTGRFQTGYPY